MSALLYRARRRRACDRYLPKDRDEEPRAPIHVARFTVVAIFVAVASCAKATHVHENDEDLFGVPCPTLPPGAEGCEDQGKLYPENCRASVNEGLCDCKRVRNDASLADPRLDPTSPAFDPRFKPGPPRIVSYLAWTDCGL